MSRSPKSPNPGLSSNEIFLLSNQLDFFVSPFPQLDLGVLTKTKNISFYSAHNVSFLVFFPIHHAASETLFSLKMNG